jgi:hypothetical protein
MAEKFRYSDQTPQREQAPVPQASDKAGEKIDHTSYTTRSGPEANKTRRILGDTAEEGLKNTGGKLPRDQI